MGMKHKGTIKLETRRLILRKLKVDDAEDYAYIWSESSAIEWKPPFSDSATKSLLKRIKSFDKPEGYCWAIVEKNNGKVIGEIFTVNNCNKTRSCEIVYGMAKAYRNKGYMTETLHCSLLFLLQEVGYNRVQGGHLADNPASGRVMGKAGMVYEGTLRQDNVNKNGELTDSIIYSMIKRDLAK